MLYLVSGAVAAGKSTVVAAAAEGFSNLVHLDEDRRRSRTTAQRRANLELWVRDALEFEAEGRDAILGSQAPLGELLAVPSAPRLEGIAASLLDAHDWVRLGRWSRRGRVEAGSSIMDHFCWAAFHRLHARDPQFEQRVLLDQPGPDQAWRRWTHWTADDPRWQVAIFDSSELDVPATVDLVRTWIDSVQRNGAELHRDHGWWKG